MSHTPIRGDHSSLQPGFRRWWFWLPTLLLSIGISVILGLPLASPVFGITACGGVLRDVDDLIPATQETTVASVTEATQLAGAQPLIVLLRTSGGRDLQAELDEAISTCPVLVDEPGSVLAVGMAVDDQTVVVQPGADIAGRIQTEDLTKRMREQIGHMPLEQILADGFRSINEELYETRNERAKQPIMSASAWGALAVLLLLAAGVGALWLAQQRQVLRHARQGAESIRAKGMDLAIDLERDQRALEKQTKDLAEWIALSEVEPITRAQLEINLHTHAVLTAWHQLANQMGTTEGLRVERFNHYATQLEAAHGDLQAAADQMMVVQGNLAQIITIIDGLDGRLAENKAQIASTQSVINVAMAKGWQISRAEADIVLAKEYADLAHKARDRQEMLGADEFLRVAEAKTAAALSGARDIERTHLDMTQQVTTVRHRQAELVESLAPAREAMAHLQANFAQRSWESVAGNGPSAQVLLDRVPERITQAEFALGLSVQNLELARQTLEGIVEDLDAAEGLIDAIHETLAGLQHASSLLPDAIRAADRAVETAVQLAQSRDNTQGIDELKMLQARIHRERTNPQPDFQALINAAELLTLQADQWVTEQRGELAIEGQIERAARSGIDQARQRCTQTAQLVQTHRRELPEDYVQVIEELAERLDEVVKEPSATRRLDQATNIRHQAMAIEHEARRVMRTQSRLLPSAQSKSRW